MLPAEIINPKIPLTAGDIQDLLAEAMVAVRMGGLDARTGVALAFMANPLLKAIELSDLEVRVKTLERENENTAQED